MEPKNGNPDAVIFYSSGFFFLCQTALKAQMAPKASPKGPGTSPSIDFGSMLDDFLMIFRIMWATFYLACRLPRGFMC